MTFKNNPLMEPVFFTPSGSRRLYKGGGGGTQNYANLDALYKEQTDSARLLREQAEANLPSAVNSYVAETNEVLDPGYVEKKAGMAATDMASANAQERAATERSLTAMGVNPNDARFAGSAKATEVSNAARLAAGKNVARTEANNYQLNVAKDKVGTFTGQSNNAATQMGNAASGLGSLAASQSNQQLAQQQAQSNNIGNAVGAGIAAYGIYNQPTTKKDGGRIKLPAGLKKVECHTMGGGVGSNQGFFQMQSIAPPPVAQAPQQGGSPVGSALGTANMIRGLYNAGAKKGGEAAAKKGAEAAAQKAGEVAATKAGEQAGVIAADTATAGAANTAAAAAATEATTAAATTAATDAAVTAAVPAVAETAAGSGLMAGLGTAGAAVGAAMPWVGAAMVAGSLLDLWNAGGEVGTQNEGMSEAEAAARFAKADQNGTIQDIRHGGKVPGEWKGNTDNVPALLTEDEHVINAEAAAMIGHDKLEQLNKQGLALRKKGYTPGRIKAAGGIRRAA
jgi:hypothetical protein